MMRHLNARAVALSVLALASSGFAQHAPHVLVPPDSATWGPASPKLPPGAQFARLVRDPSKPGEPYVFRAKLPDGYSDDEAGVGECARAHGETPTVLHATEAGRRVYERMGYASVSTHTLLMEKGFLEGH